MSQQNMETMQTAMEAFNRRHADESERYLPATLRSRQCERPITSFHTHAGRSEALRAVGLSE
jgi:hypothetical protein